MPTRYHDYSICARRCIYVAAAFCYGTLVGTAEDAQTQEARPSEIHRLIEAAKVSSYAGPPYCFDADVFLADTRHLPIGVFDSGIGGLTVLEAILGLDAFHNDTLSPGSDGRRDFENERFVYLGDQANMPYGNYASVGKGTFLRELILKDAIFLLGKRYWPSNHASQPVFDKPPVKAIVIACNTATAYGLEDLRAAMKTWDIPILVVGVVEAGARGVAELIAPSDGRRGVAVLATIGTCSSMAYPKAINTSLGLAGKRVPEIIQQGSVGLAGAVEGDPAYIASNDSEPDDLTAYQGPSVQSTVAPIDPAFAKRYGFEESGLSGEPRHPETWRLGSISNYARYDVLSLIEKYRAGGGSVPIDTVVLGCTHFPLVQTEIQSAFAQLRDYQEDGHQPYRSLIAEEIFLVNPAELTAKELFRSLAKARLHFDSLAKENRQKDQFYISVPNPHWPAIRLIAEGGLDREYKYSRATGQLAIEDTRVVPMTQELLPDSSLKLIRTRLPNVWKRLSD